LQAALTPIIAADPLDVADSDPTPWEGNADEQRLFWRLVYLVESETEEQRELGALAGRVFRCLDSTGSAADTCEFLPVLFDQSRLLTIIAKHRAGIISRVGFLSVLAESGYPGHVKLWLEHAGAEPLGTLAQLLEAGEYGRAARLVELPPSA
jgi:hypothetical protein